MNDILRQCRKTELKIWKIIFDLQNLISELECNSELPDKLDNTLYQLYVTKGKLDWCIDHCVWKKYSKLKDNLLQARDELDLCITAMLDSELEDNLLEAREELVRCIQLQESSDGMEWE